MDTGKHYSYNTLLTDYFMGELFCNQTYYSVTTRRHQARLPEVDFNHRLHNCPYGNFNIYDAFKFEIMDIQAELTRRTTKRKIFKNSSELAKLHQKISIFTRISYLL